MSMHCDKSLFVLASHQKIPVPRIDNPAVDTGIFFWPLIDLFSQSLVRQLFGSGIPEKSSGLWNNTFYIPPCHKSLANGGRPGLAPGTQIFLHGRM
jgi:hypothetical protein